MQLRFMQELAALYTYLRSRRLATRRKPRSAWVFPRPQNWFEELLTNRAVDFWWKENFRVSRVTFDRICYLVGPALERQNTRFREAIPVTKPHRDQQSQNFPRLGLNRRSVQGQRDQEQVGMVDDDTAGIGKADKDVEMETDETDCQ